MIMPPALLVKPSGDILQRPKHPTDTSSADHNWQWSWIMKDLGRSYGSMTILPNPYLVLAAL